MPATSDDDEGPQPCCDSEDNAKEVQWSFVGPKHGQFEAQLTYAYVGEGSGTFEKVEGSSNTRWRPRKCCMCLCCTAVTLCILGVLASSSAPTLSKLVKSENSGRDYNCADGEQDWEHKWSDDKKQWCCNAFGRGCVASSRHANVSVLDKATNTYVCELTLNNDTRNWTAPEREWCCSHKEVGCVRPDEFDCDAGIERFETGWSRIKKAWCCKHRDRGCSPTSTSTETTTATTTTLSTETTSSTQTTSTKATTSKKATSKKATSAESATSKKTKSSDAMTTAELATTTPNTWYDCSAGADLWKTGWTDGKKHWCCDKQPGGPGCSPCENKCAYRGRSDTCRSHIQFLADHGGSCDAASLAVVNACSACDNCLPESAECKDGEEEKKEEKKKEDENKE
mmetsp:Transcript_81266/g.263518  ORF Transcript_81266/g.263518 Transcript_81266/m.263518 type:complete len:397 (-) Transcript_81266:89-1279(-)